MSNTHKEKQIYWNKVIEQWKDSGVGMTRFCKENNLCRKAFTDGRRRSLTMPFHQLQVSKKWLINQWKALGYGLILVMEQSLWLITNSTHRLSKN